MVKDANTRMLPLELVQLEKRSFQQQRWRLKDRALMMIQELLLLLSYHKLEFNILTFYKYIYYTYMYIRHINSYLNQKSKNWSTPELMSSAHLSESQVHLQQPEN